jgi:hypothetical protein
MQGFRAYLERCGIWILSFAPRASGSCQRSRSNSASSFFMRRWANRWLWVVTTRDRKIYVETPTAARLCEATGEQE